MTLTHRVNGEFRAELLSTLGLGWLDDLGVGSTTVADG